MRRIMRNPPRAKISSSTSSSANCCGHFGARTYWTWKYCVPEVDSGGYDLALEFRGLIRHVQLKSSYRGARRANVTASVKLLDRPSACILWIYFDPDTLSLGPFLWFGAAPGERMPPLGEQIARHTKPNAMRQKADRPAHRIIARNRFAKLETIDAVIRKLVGV